MKTCPRCGVSKEHSEFHKRSVNKSGLCSYCKECARVYYKSWQEQSPGRKTRHADWKAVRREDTRKTYVEYMAGRACVDCGYSDWLAALQWDHIGDNKVAGVTALINSGNPWTKVLEEIEKCELRCCNCHAIKSAERGQWWTHRVALSQK